MTIHTYDTAFFDYITRGSLASAAVVLPAVQRHMEVTSVVDFGCGIGAWLATWKHLGVRDVLGIDGHYVSRADLLLDPTEFRATDLSHYVAPERQFDLVQCLEVAEHLPIEAAPHLVASLTAHGRVVLFSAAPPGQGGENHMNEQPYDYWRDLFRRRDYVMLDALRPLLQTAHAVEPWYRYNTFLFVRSDLFPRLSSQLRASRVPDDQPVPDISPPWYRLRKSALARLPRPFLTGGALLKKHLTLILRRS